LGWLGAGVAVADFPVLAVDATGVARVGLDVAVVDGAVAARCGAVVADRVDVGAGVDPVVIVGDGLRRGAADEDAVLRGAVVVARGADEATRGGVEREAVDELRSFADAVRVDGAVVRLVDPADVDRGLGVIARAVAGVTRRSVLGAGRSVVRVVVVTPMRRRRSPARRVRKSRDSAAG
jgi:hypothetical protein